MRKDYMRRVVHCHSCFSKLEGVSTAEDIIYAALADDIPAVAEEMFARNIFLR